MKKSNRKQWTHVLFYMNFVLCVGILFPHRGRSQEPQDSLLQVREKAVRVYIDCNFCDRDYIRSEITFVNYVRDRNEAQVHILVTTQRTGSGGTEYTLSFIGQQNYDKINDTLRYTSQKTDTDEIVRSGLVRTLKLGLMRYVAKTPFADQIAISFKLPTEPTKVQDKWDFWVFSIRLNSYFNGEQRTDSRFLSGSLSANRTTPDLKINLSSYANYSENNFEIDDTTTISSFSRSKGFNSLIVFSLTDHWSYGFSTSAFSSTYSNMILLLSGAPALEYDLFPYSESTRRQLRFLYRTELNHRDYDEETIFDKNSELLLSQNVSISLEVKEPWGSVNASLEGSHYFHDFNRYRLELFGGVSLRLFEGVSFDIFGNVSKIHDQLSLPKRGASTEEILLQRRQLETQYQYFVSFGVSYTFGSIYNNVVNPRFGGSGGGFSFSFSN